mgnify:CR=1 FL=1
MASLLFANKLYLELTSELSFTDRPILFPMIQLFSISTPTVLPYCSVPIANMIWKFTTYSIGIMSYFMFLGMLHHLFEYELVLRFRWVLLLFVAIYLFVVTPIGLIMRLLGKDILKIARRIESVSYTHLTLPTNREV